MLPLTSATATKNSAGSLTAQLRWPQNFDELSVSKTLRLTNDPDSHSVARRRKGNKDDSSAYRLSGHPGPPTRKIADFQVDQGIFGDFHLVVMNNFDANNNEKAPEFGSHLLIATPCNRVLGCEGTPTP